jgi:hypothetical protein
VIRPVMTRRVLCGSIGTIFLACWSLLLSGCGATLIGPTAPSGYRIRLPNASQTLRGQTLRLTVHVTDAAGQPLDDVPVHFRLSDPWTAVARIDPPVVHTLNGDATATFRARTAGHMAVHIRVENLSATVDIVVLGDTPHL